MKVKSEVTMTGTKERHFEKELCIKYYILRHKKRKNPINYS